MLRLIEEQALDQTFPSQQAAAHPLHCRFPMAQTFAIDTMLLL
jgi:hypothetical protein